MLVVLCVALGVMLPPLQPPQAADRSYAEQLAREGRTVEAIRLFERIVERDPADTEARLWIARLDLRRGLTDRAEAGFRSVLRDHPADIDARVGLGTALTRQGASREALTILHEAEGTAGENAELFTALGTAYRRTGDDVRSMEYFRRAKAVAPEDGDIRDAIEAATLAHGHSIAFEGFGERADSAATSGALELTLRVGSRLHVGASGRVQERSGSTDAIGGGGVRWHPGFGTAIGVQLLGGSRNVALANADFSGTVVRYFGIFEVGGTFRVLGFSAADVVTASPIFAWDGGRRGRIDARYTYSSTSFDSTGESSADHSGFVRGTWRGWRRVSLNGTYAYGIESFENLTADRLASLDTSTAAAGLRITTPSLTVITTTWEHLWRSNDTRLDRLTVSLIQFFR